RIRKDRLLASLPPEWPEDMAASVRRSILESRRKVVVLDDDPTGTQAVHDIPVLTEWRAEALAIEFRNELPAVFILTNSRSMSAARAQTLNHDIAQNLLAASRETAQD